TRWKCCPDVAGPMPDASAGQQNLAENIACFQRSMRISHCVHGDPLLDHGAHGTPLDEWPEVFSNSSNDTFFLLHRARSQSGGRDTGPLGDQPPQVELTLGSPLHSDHDEPAAGGERIDIAAQVFRTHVVEN